MLSLDVLKSELFVSRRIEMIERDAAISVVNIITRKQFVISKINRPTEHARTEL